MVLLEDHVLVAVEAMPLKVRLEYEEKACDCEVRKDLEDPRVDAN